MSKRVRMLTSLCTLFSLIAGAASAQESAEEMLQSALYKQEIEGDLEGAIELFRTIAEQRPDNRPIAARALLQLGLAYETLGLREAERTYRDLLSEYPEQSDAVDQATVRLAVISPDAQAEPGLVARRLWRTRDDAIYPGALSPDGREVAFVQWTDYCCENSGDLLAVDVETGEVRIVGKTTGIRDGLDTEVEASVWSPNGDRLVYAEFDAIVRDNRGIYHMDLHVVDADGSNHRIVSDNPQNSEFYPRAWSSDGTWVAALIKGWDGAFRIATVSMEDGRVTVLKTLPTRSVEGGAQRTWTISVSPDDRFLAYSYSPSPLDKPEIHVLAVDGSRETVVAPSSRTDVNPLWTPEGSRLVFLSDRSGSVDLWAVEMSDGNALGEPQLIQPHLGPVSLLGFTADGTLSYRSRVPTTIMRIVSIDADGKLGSSEPVSDRFVGRTRGASVSPDGSRIAYLASGWAGLDAHDYVVVKSLRDGRERDIELPASMHPSTRLEWSSNGQSILLRADHLNITDTGIHEREEGFAIDVESGEIQQEPYLWDYAGIWNTNQARFVSGRQSDGLRELGIRLIGWRGRSDWSRFLEGSRPGESQLWFGPPSEGTRLGDGSGNAETVVDAVGAFELSPDGTRFAYTNTDGVWVGYGDATWQVAVLPVTLDAEPTLIHSRQQDEPEGCACVIRWTPDGSHLIYGIAEGDRASSEEPLKAIYRIDVNGGEPELLDWTMSQERLGELEFFPDGRRAVHTVVNPDGGSELWTLSGFPWQSEDRR